MLGIAAASAPAAFPGANGPFVVERFADLYAVAADGSVTNLTGTGTAVLESRPAASADGGKIVYARDQRDGTDSEIWTMNADGSDQQRLATPGLAADAYEPTWSPDGSSIVFSHPVTSESSAIYVQPVDGSVGRTLVPDDFNSHRTPDWSPDGSTVVFVRGSALRVVPADSSAASSPLRDELGNAIGSASDPDWSPDGSQIVFVSRFHSTRPDGIYVVPAAGGAPRLVLARSYDDDDPVWSPDGTKIGFVGTREGGKQVFTVNVDGTGLTRLTTDAEYYSSIDWSVGAVAPTNGSPTASFTVAPASGITATSFSFDGGASSDPDGDPLTFAWAFGDGGSGSGTTTTYAYAAAGSYTATLTVSDGRGGSGSTTRTVTVTAPPPANLIVDDDRAQCPSAAHATIQSAVDAAAPGATVTVCAGSYDGVTVGKQLTLRGPSADTSRAATCASAVVGATTDAIVTGGTITLAASGIDLRGFVIKDATTGLVTDGAGSGYTVANNLFEDSTDGMQLASGGSSPSVASGNCFRRHTRAAIFSIAVPVKNVQIQDNAFVDNGNNGGDGWAMALGQFRFGDSHIWVENVTIARNSSSGDNRFIEIPGSRDVVIEDNRSDGTVTSVFLANNNIGTRVSGNSFEDGHGGIYVSSIGPFGGLPNSNLVISGNVVRRMSSSGIATEAGASMLSSTVSGNTSTGNPNGIWIADGSTGNTISGNTLTGNLIHDCRDDTTGAGTAGTANTWSSNTAATESRLGLCVPANRAPTASFTVSPGSGTTATSFAFDGSASSDPDGDALTYAWAFGDGGTGSGATTTHSYAEARSYTVTLTVSDGRGGSDSTTRSVTVAAANRNPVASFSVSPASGPTSTSFAFDGSASSDPDGDALTYAWAFGDGATATGASVTHAYSSPGTYDATLTVSDGRGGSSSGTKPITVSAPSSGSEPTKPNRRPVARVTFTPAAPIVGQPVRLDAGGSTDADGDTLTYSWSESGFVSGTDKTLLRTFTTPGDKTITLTVSDPQGLTASATAVVPVAPAPVPPAGSQVVVGRVVERGTFASGAGAGVERSVGVVGGSRPLPGAVVRVVGKTGSRSAVTDVSGRYQLLVPVGGCGSGCRVEVDPPGAGPVFWVEDELRPAVAPSVSVVDAAVYVGSRRVFLGGVVESARVRAGEVRVVALDRSGSDVEEVRAARVFEVGENPYWLELRLPATARVERFRVELLVAGVVVERVFVAAGGAGVALSGPVSVPFVSAFELGAPTLTAT